MTIAEAITLADQLKPNMMGEGVKIKFLNQIDQTIWDEIISQHAPAGNRRGFFLKGISELITEELALAAQQNKAAVVAFIRRLGGKFHEEILRVQGWMPEAKLLFLQGMEELLTGMADAAGEYTKADLISFLESIQETIATETAEDPERPSYDSDTPADTELLVGSPHDMIYVYWLITQIDHLNMEMDKFNNDREIFQNAYDTFSDEYTRKHFPVQKTREFRI